MARRRKGEKRGKREGGARTKKQRGVPSPCSRGPLFVSGFTFLHEFGSPGSGFCPLSHFGGVEPEGELKDPSGRKRKRSVHALRWARRLTSTP